MPFVLRSCARNARKPELCLLALNVNAEVNAEESESICRSEQEGARRFRVELYSWGRRFTRRGRAIAHWQQHQRRKDRAAGAHSCNDLFLVNWFDFLNFTNRVLYLSS